MMGLNVDLLQDTFRRIKNENGGTEPFGLRFYGRLFEKYPSVKPLFNTPPEEQHKKLLASIGAIVSSVKYPEKLLPYLHALGIRHVSYKTEDSHYPAVAENLVAVLSEHLSKEGEWTPEMETTWKEALQTVAEVMIDAANHPEKFKEELEQAGYLPNGFKVNQSLPWELASA